jgi:hypothetical protein
MHHPPLKLPIVKLTVPFRHAAGCAPQQSPGRSIDGKEPRRPVHLSLLFRAPPPG